MSEQDPRHSNGEPGANRVGNSTAPRFAYKAFLSYSQQADGVLASELEHGLERFAKKWRHRRVFDVFRDTSSLSATPGLWPALQKTLDASEFYILLASPESADSPWVRKELEYWLARRDRGHILLVLTGGTIRWDEVTEDFDWAGTTALASGTLSKVFEHEPLWVECAWARGLDVASIRKDSRFYDRVATLASTLHGRSKSDLYGEDLRQHRRQRLAERVAAALLAGLLLVAIGIGWLLAVSLRNEMIARADADRKARIAKSGELAALSVSERNKRLDLSLLLAVEAHRTENTIEARSSLYRALQDRPRIKTFLHMGERLVTGVAFSPDGKTLATVYSGGVVLWDVAGRRRLAEEPLVMKEGGVHSVAFSPDGKTLAAGSGAVVGDAVVGRVVLCDMAGRRRLAEEQLLVREGVVQSVTFSPDGKTLAAGYRAVSGGGGVVLWDLAARRRLAEQPLLVREGDVPSVAFSPDGKTLASGYGTVAGDAVVGGVVLWEMAGRKRLVEEPLLVNEGFVQSVAFSPDNKTLAAGYRAGIDLVSGVVLWETAGRRRLAEEPLVVKEGGVHSVAFSPGGKTLAAGFGGVVGAADARGVVLWEMAGRRRLTEELLLVREGDVHSVAFSPDGKTLAAGYRAVSGVGGVSGVVLCDLAGRRRLAEEPLLVREGDVHSVTFGPDGKTLAAGYRAVSVGGGGVVLWDLAGRRREADEPLLMNEGFVKSVAFSPDNKTLAAGYGAVVGGGGVVLWDVAGRGRLAEELLLVREGLVESVAFSPDGRTLAAGHSGGPVGGVVLWDMKGRRRLVEERLLEREGLVASVAFSPDGKTLAAGFIATAAGVGGAVLWDLPGRRRLAEDPLLVKEGGVYSVAFSPDGQTLATGYNGGVVLWDVARRKRLADAPLVVREGFVNGVAFSPDGQTLAAGYRAGFGGVVLWDVAGRRRVVEEPLLVNEGFVQSVAFSPDNKTLAAGYRAGGIVLWDVDLKSWERLAGRVANRNFTRDEWRQYFADEPYRTTFPELPP